MTGEIWAAVFGRGTEFVLVPEDSPASLELAKVREYPYCGLMGYVHGQSISRCEPDLDAVLTMIHATGAFARYVVTRLRQKAGN